MKNWIVLVILVSNVTLAVAQLTTENFTINEFEISIRSDGKVFSTDNNGVGLRYVDDDETLHNGLGLVGNGINPPGNFYSCGHIADYSNPSISRFTSGLRSNTTGQLPTENLYSQFYSITRSDILKHIQDYEDNGIIDLPINNIFTWPGHENAYYWDSLNIEPPIHLAPFYDINRNNIYEPELGEYPNIDDCSIQTMPITKIILKYFTTDSIFRYGVNNLDMNGYTLVYGFDCSNNVLDLSEFIFVDHTIQSIGFTDFLDFKLAFDYDFSFGNSDNDYVAYDTVDHTVMCYNDPLVAETHDRAKGKVLSIYLLGNLLEFFLFNDPPIYHDPKYFNHYDLDTNLMTSGPLNSDQFYNHTLDGLWNDGSSKTALGYGYFGEDTPTHRYSFDGYVGTTEGWNEISENNISGKRNALQVYPPITLQPFSKNTWTHILQVSETPDGLPNYIESQMTRTNLSLFLTVINEFPCIPNTSTIDYPQPIGIIVFPNPGNSQFCINAEIPILNIDLYNKLGQLIKSIKYANDQVILDIDHPGIYFAHITTTQGTHIEKLVKI